MPLSALIKRTKTYLPGLNEKRLRKAYDFAAECHKGQTRMDGSPYITHPLAVCMNLAELQVDEDTLVACLLHDVPEDTCYTIQEVEKKFGKKVAFLVEGVTKLTKVKYRHDIAERQIESLKKFFLHSAKDLRIILIKLADRLHNMSTLQHVRQEKQLRIAKETMEIYAPIANLLGIWGIKSQLEDLSFQYIYPREYDLLTKEIKRTASHHQKILAETIQKLKRILKLKHIAAEVEGRPKSLYSIFTKMVRTGQRLQDLNDILGIRLVVKDRDTCYSVLGLVHSLFRPKSGRIKDYIAVPKANAYQSLHTTVFGLEGTPTEFQIRTHDMHIEAEYGIASYYFYKKSKSAPHELKTKASEWVQHILHLQKELKSNYDFLENLKVDVFQDRIFVFTPQGDVVDLPQGANGIDFAYHIHTDLGDHAVRMIRSGSNCPLTTPLKTGDTVEIVLSSTQKFPQREWIEKVKTNLARDKIKASLKKQSATVWRAAGLQFFRKELNRFMGRDLKTVTPAQKQRLLEHFKISNWKKFLEALGNGSIAEHDFIPILYTKNEILGIANSITSSYKTPLSKIKYHKNRSRLLDDLESKTSLPYYRIHLMMECEDRVGLLRDMGIHLANIEVNIYQIGVLPGKRPHEALIDIIIEVLDLEQLHNAFEAIESVDGILRVYRIPQKELKGTFRK